MSIHATTNGNKVVISVRGYCEHLEIEKAEVFMQKVDNCITEAKRNAHNILCGEILNLDTEIQKLERELEVKKQRVNRLRDERDGTPGRLYKA